MASLCRLRSAGKTLHPNFRARPDRQAVRGSDNVSRFIGTWTRQATDRRDQSGSSQVEGSFHNNGGSDDINKIGAIVCTKYLY